MTDITYLQVVNEIRRVAAEQPDFEYEPTEHTQHGLLASTCVYVKKLAPHSYAKSCIVGHALVNLGVDPDRLYFRLDKVPGARTLLCSLFGEPQTPSDVKRQEWINLVQKHQDRGDAWSQAVQMADEGIADYEARVYA